VSTSAAHQHRPDRQLPHSRLGIASVGLSVVLTAPLLDLSLAHLVEATDYGRIAVEDGAEIAVYVVFLGILASGFALALGIAGLVQKRRNRLFAILGTVLSVALALTALCLNTVWD